MRKKITLITTVFTIFIHSQATSKYKTHILYTTPPSPTSRVGLGKLYKFKSGETLDRLQLWGGMVVKQSKKSQVSVGKS